VLGGFGTNVAIGSNVRYRTRAVPNRRSLPPSGPYVRIPAGHMAVNGIKEASFTDASFLFGSAGFSFSLT